MEMVSSKRPSRILLFTKSEEPGKVKTRLHPVLDIEQCLQLHVAMLQDTIDCCLRATSDLRLYVAGSPEFSFAVPAPIFSQAEGDLGHRMSEAFRENLATAGKVVIVGTDAPGLTPALLQEALASLDEHELTLGPSFDGGYYLVGMRRLLPEIFRDMEWSTSTVLSKTLERVHGSNVHLLPPLYDIDLPEDLSRLEADLAAGLFPHAQHTRAFLNARLRR